MQKLLTRNNPYIQADTVNHHNFPAFTRSLEEQYVQMLTTNTLGGTFYADDRELVKGTLELNKEMLAKDPLFMAQAVFYARSIAFMRLQPIVGLAFLSTSEGNTHFESLFNHIIRTPNDLASFVNLCKNGTIRKGLGRRVKRQVNTWLLNMSDYHVVKYGSDGKDFSLRDIMLVTHPKSPDARWNSVANYLLGNLEKVNWSLIPQIAAYEELKKCADDENVVLRMIEDGKLPHEVVTGVVKPTKKVWQAISKQMPLFAYLRHLRTLHKAEALDQADFAKRLTPEAVKKAKILPMRLYSAFNELREYGLTKTDGALSVCLDATADALPELKGRVAMFLDNSGSMEMGTISEHSSLTYLKVGSMLMGLFARRGTDARYLVFNTRTVETKILPQTPVLSVIDQISRLESGGTDLASPIDYMSNHKIAVDTVIGITDSEDWAGRGFLRAWEDYRAKVNPKAKAYLIQLAPSRGLISPQERDDVVYIYGWSDSIFPFIANTNAVQVDEIRKLDFTATPETLK